MHVNLIEYCLQLIQLKCITDLLNDVWWSYNRGKISSNYIDDDGLTKLKEIACKLNAKVIGDEGEGY